LPQSVQRAGATAGVAAGDGLAGVEGTAATSVAEGSDGDGVVGEQPAMSAISTVAASMRFAWRSRLIRRGGYPTERVP
jgi:hypothetical protein